MSMDEEREGKGMIKDEERNGERERREGKLLQTKGKREKRKEVEKNEYRK